MFGRLHLRNQIVLCILAVQFAALVLTTTILIMNAREAVRLEVTSAEKSARALMLTTLGYALQETSPSDVVPRLAEAIVEPRHVDIALVDSRRGVMPVRELQEIEAPSTPPTWFARLVTPPFREIRLPIEANGIVFGYVSMTAAPQDEISEVWSDVVSLFWIMALTTLVSTIGATLLVNQTLRPLDRLRDALRQLREGALSTRIGKSRSTDLAPIFEGFNALSEALECAEEDMAMLNRRIVELGDAERRAIAMELHDEFGPCLFGLKVKATAIARIAEDTSNSELAVDAQAVQAIVGQIQASSSRLLTTLRPMAIGQLPLVDALADLFEAFHKTHPGINWDVDLPPSLAATPEIIDLTIYRFFQEGATNALRHGRPTRISISLQEQDKGDGPFLICEVEDDGIGMDEKFREGRGLTAMRDRIDAVGGTVTLYQNKAAGFRLSCEVPALTSRQLTQELRAAS